MRPRLLSRCYSNTRHPTPPLRLALRDMEWAPGHMKHADADLVKCDIHEVNFVIKL